MRAPLVRVADLRGHALPVGHLAHSALRQAQIVMLHSCYLLRPVSHSYIELGIVWEPASVPAWVASMISFGFRGGSGGDFGDRKITGEKVCGEDRRGEQDSPDM